MTDIKAQAGKVLGHVAGYVATRTLSIGLSKGIFAAIGEHADGIDIAGLATQLKCDAFYLEVWCRSALAAEMLEVSGDGIEDYDPAARRFVQTSERRFSLAEHMAQVLLNKDCPAYVGAIPGILKQKEIFDAFEANLDSGEGLWWNDVSSDMIDAVSDTGWSFYVRLVPGALEKVPGLKDRLQAGMKVAQLCCGAGKGTQRLIETYPNCTFTAVDGDEYSLKLTGDQLRSAGLEGRVELVHTSLEDMQIADMDLVLINISMHECRDIDKVVENVKAGLKPGGCFVISDFPFPSDRETQRSVPGRIMSGIQFFEALIGDQLMPTKVFYDRLVEHGFKDVASFDVSPVHAMTYGTK